MPTNSWKKDFEAQVIGLLNSIGESSAKNILTRLDIKDQVSENKARYHLARLVKDPSSPIRAKGSTTNRVYYVRQKKQESEVIGYKPPKSRKMKVVKVHGQIVENGRPLFNRMLSLLEEVWQSGL